MRVRPLVSVIAAVAVLWCSSAWAATTQHIATTQDLQQAVASQQASDDENRQAVDRALDRSDAQALAARMGLDIKDAHRAVGLMSSDELARAANAARQAEQAGLDPSGGSTTIIISLTTLLLIIIIILLIAK
jgi:hypothetical protein